MKENPYENNMNEQDEEKINYQELLFRYIIHWPWFVASDWCLGVFTFSNSRVSSFRFHHD